MLTQLRALTGRHWTLLVRHPLLVGTNLLSTLCVALVCAWAFWSVNLELAGGVLQRMGLLFFVGAHFLLTGLANIGVWKQERLLYFHERGVGCYGTVPFVLAKTVFADALPMRIVPALLLAAIIYPTVGLAGATDPSSAGGVWYFGPVKAASFVGSLCVTNLAASAMFSCIGISCESTAVAVLAGVLYALFTLLFSGFLANFGALSAAFSWLSYLSILRYAFELIMSNELLGQVIVVNKRWPPGPHPIAPINGRVVLQDFLGFDSGWQADCARIIPVGNPPISACWFDLYMPAVIYVVLVVLSIFLLKFCARDPH